MIEGEEGLQRRRRLRPLRGVEVGVGDVDDAKHRG